MLSSKRLDAETSPQRSEPSEKSQQKSADEVREIVRSILAGLPPDARNVGAAMKIAMAQLKGLADGNLVRQVVTEELSS